MRILNVNWDPLTDETKVTLTKGFAECDVVLKLDVLMDTIVLLQGMYEIAAEEDRADFELKRLNKIAEKNGEEL